MTSKTSKLLKLNLVLLLVAVGMASYMVWHHYELVNGEGGFGSFCSLSETVDCDAVNASLYSEVFGIPLATLALSYYLFASILTVVALVNAYARREALVLLVPLAVGSLGATVATLGIMAFVLKKWCVMCLGLHALDLLTFVVTLLAFRSFAAESGFARELGQADRKRSLTFAGLGLGLFIVTFGLTSQLREEHPFDAEAFVNEFRSQKIQDIPPGDSPRMGFQGPNPPVQIIEFADFQCPACGFAAKQMHRLTSVYADRIQLVFKNYPLDSSCNPSMERAMHPFACVAARAGYCAHKQGKFVQLYEKMYGHQKDLNRDTISAWAQEVGLNKEAFESCLTSDEALSSIRNDVMLADRAGLNSTPTFFVAGRMVRGAIDEAKLKLLLRELGK